MNARGPKIGIKDVARAAGVSVGTVSHVLNKPELVSPQRLKAVQDAIEELGYVPNNAARTLKEGTSRVVGIIVPSGSPYFSNLALGVQQAAEERGLSVLNANTFGDPTRRKRYLNLFEEQRVRGTIISAPRGDLTEELASSARGTPVVLASAHDPSGSLCSVCGDDVVGGRLAAEHLIETGRRRIALMGEMDLAATACRLEGARGAAQAAGLELELIPVNEVSIPAGRAATEELIARPAAERPDAIFATSDMLAFGVLDALVAAGVDVPREIAVVGYDDVVYSNTTIVPLTSIQQNELKIGALALELLEESIADPAHEHRAIVLEPTLVVRASSQVGLPPVRVMLG